MTHEEFEKAAMPEDALFSDFKKDGYSSRQVLHQLA